MFLDAPVVPVVVPVLAVQAQHPALAAVAGPVSPP
jgi:hypothetical protein